VLSVAAPADSAGLHDWADPRVSHTNDWTMPWLGHPNDNSIISWIANPEGSAINVPVDHVE